MFLDCCSLNLVLVLNVVSMGRWSELSACIVCQCVLFAIAVLAIVMSGEVGDWLECGSRVGVFVLSVICEEFCMMSAIRIPL